MIYSHWSSVQPELHFFSFEFRNNNTSPKQDTTNFDFLSFSLYSLLLPTAAEISASVPYKHLASSPCKHTWSAEPTIHRPRLR